MVQSRYNQINVNYIVYASLAGYTFPNLCIIIIVHWPCHSRPVLHTARMCGSPKKADLVNLLGLRLRSSQWDIKRPWPINSNLMKEYARMTDTYYRPSNFYIRSSNIVLVSETMIIRYVYHVSASPSCITNRKTKFLNILAFAVFTWRTRNSGCSHTTVNDPYHSTRNVVNSAINHDQTKLKCQ
jgi:hypothetical protein